MDINYVSMECLAAKLNLPQKYLKELARQGKISYLNVNGRYRYEVSTVEQELKNLAMKGKQNGK